MNATIIYDEFDFATRAKVMLERAAYRAGEATRWKVKPWRLNLLAPREMADALNDAAAAHLIVLALRHSECLLDWLEQWAARRQVQDAALAVFEGGKGDRLSATAAPELLQFAERHGLSFILGDINPTEDESAAVVRDLNERAAAQTPTLLRILEHGAPHDRHQGWGINE